MLHLKRDIKKRADQNLPGDVIRRIPDLIQSPLAVLLDKRNGGLIYVVDDTFLNQKRGKLVIEINYEDKVRINNRRHSIRSNSVRTGGMVEARKLADKRFYELIEGKL